MKHLVTLFCGHEILAHSPAQQYCNQKCVGFHVKRSKKPKRTPQKRRKQTKSFLPSSSPLWDVAKLSRNCKGYIVLYVRNSETGHVYYRSQHIVFWERAHGMRVPKRHCLHHLNGNPADNRLENILCMSVSLHLTLHARLAKLAKAPLSTVQFKVERHAIIEEFTRKALEIMYRKTRWGGLPSQKASEEHYENL